MSLQKQDISTFGKNTPQWLIKIDTLGTPNGVQNQEQHGNNWYVLTGVRELHSFEMIRLNYLDVVSRGNYASGIRDWLEIVRNISNGCAYFHIWNLVERVTFSSREKS